jgi:putative redox protein
MNMANEMKIQIHQISASASEATIRRHRVLIDRPAEKGGGDAGPMGGELFLAAVGGCFMSNLLAAIRAREAEIADVRVEVAGFLTDSPARFAGVELQVAADSRDRELLERLVEIADRGCVMMNTLRGTLDMRVLIAAAV